MNFVLSTQQQSILAGISTHGRHLKHPLRSYERQLCRAAWEPDQPTELSTDTMDWRSFRAGLVSAEKRESHWQVLPDFDESSHVEAGDIWAHQISAPETGCLVVSRKTAGDMGFFNNSVILLLQHSNSMGSLGLLLGRKRRTLPQGPFAQVMSLVSGLYIGGPVDLDKILILHGPPELDDSLEVLEDVYIGGWREARAKAQANIDSAESLPEFSMYSGSCGWGPGQLQREEELGAWWVVSASPGCIRELLRGNRSETRIRSEVLELAGIQDTDYVNEDAD